MKDLFDIAGKTVLITGASSGIGAHMAAMFAGRGCNVVLTARRKEKLEAVTREIASNKDADNAKLLAVSMDVNDRASVEAGVQAAVAGFGGIDILLNNAGIAKTGKLLDMPEQDWQMVMDTNLNSVWRVGQIAARQMIRQKEGGSIINTASILAFACQRQNANYGAAKSAVVHLTRSMALEWGSRGIRVNAIAPGYFETDINRDFLSSEKGKLYLDGLFPKRAGNLVELEGPILLLASQAGSYINGTVLTVDGGTLLTGA